MKNTMINERDAEMRDENPNFILKEDHDDGIVVLRLNRPHKRNALNDALFQELKEKVRAISNDSTARACIITGTSENGNRFFSAGIDLNEIVQALQGQVDPEVVLVKAKEWQDTFTEIAHSPIPFICAIDGYCYGAALELALACDFRVAEPTAKLGLLETKLGVIPDLGGITRLTRLLGVTRSKRLIFLSEVLSGIDAHHVGLIDWLASNEESSLETAMKIARTIARNAPLAIRASKRVIQSCLEVSEAESLALEREEQRLLFKSKDALEGFLAALQKRAPQFKGE